MPSVVVLCTDFGPASPYVGQMKLAIASIDPAGRVIDLAHDLPAQDVVAAALVLAAGARVSPTPCVLCAVIDPGVGSDRRILAADLGNGRFAVLPDNGVLGALGEPMAVHVVTNVSLGRPSPSSVFHGRDIMAPVAARLAAGLPIAEVGPAVATDGLAVLPRPLRAPAEDAQIIYADSFGNLVSNLHAEDIPGTAAGLRLGGHSIPIVSHYSAAPVGALIALVGSYDRLEIAVRNGSAREVLGVELGAPIILRPATRPPDARST